MMDKTEEHVMSWLPKLWSEAIDKDTDDAWGSVYDCLYGALQACTQAGAYEDHAAYSLLSSVAFQHRLGCILSKYKEAA